MARASTFTSYINAELPANLDQTWNRYEQVATRTYSNIAKRAAEASRAAAGLSGGRGAGGIGIGAGQAATRYATQMRAVEQVNRRVERSTRDVTGSISRQSREMDR